MKAISIVMVSLLATAAATAQTALQPVTPIVTPAPAAQQVPPVASTLAGTMKIMSSKLKQLTVQVTDASKNESSLQLATDFVAAILSAKAFTPSTADTAERKTLFDKMIDDAATLGTKLVEALKANDNATAIKILNDLVQAKKDGHTEFK